MQAPGCLLPYSNGITVPAYYKNPMVEGDLDGDMLEGWDDLLENIVHMALLKADHEESTFSDQELSEKADLQGDGEMFDPSDREAE